MSKLRKYLVYILRQDNDFDPLVISAERQKSKPVKNFVHRGHKYHFDTEKSFVIHELFSLRYWLIPDRFQRYDRLMLFREPSDPLHGIEIPIEPLRVPTMVNCIEESPFILKGVTRSNVLARYRAKQKFKSFGMPQWWVIVIIGIFVVIALLIFTGHLSIPGVTPRV